MGINVKDNLFSLKAVEKAILRLEDERPLMFLKGLS